MEDNQKTNSAPNANVNAKIFRMLAKTLYGLEDVLAEEPEFLGAGNIETHNRAVSFTGNQALLYRANIACRLATRILKPIYEFKANNEKELYRNVNRIDWSQYLTPAHTIAIDTVISHSTFTNSLFVAQRAKDAIVDHIRKKTGDRPTVDVKNPDVRINLHIHENNATLSLDSSGEPLSRRGYRLEAGEAPIGEVLAAGILDIIGWNGEIPLIDPMCGSGTFVIEAALKVNRVIPTTKGRDFAFTRWQDFDEDLFNSIVDAAESVNFDSDSEEQIDISGYDIDTKQLSYAEHNARRATVSNCTDFEQQDFFKDDYQTQDSVAVFNPPYNQRLSLEDAREFYKQIGNTLKAKYSGSTVYIITSNLEAIKAVGLKATRKVTLYNGPLECRLLEYQMFKGKRKEHLQTEADQDQSQTESSE